MPGYGAEQRAAKEARRRFERGYDEGAGNVRPYKGQAGPGPAFSGGARTGRRRDEGDRIAGDSRQRAREAVRANLEAARANIPGVREARLDARDATRDAEESMGVARGVLSAGEEPAIRRNAKLEAHLIPKMFGADSQTTFNPRDPQHQEWLRQAKVQFALDSDQQRVGSGVTAGGMSSGTGQLQETAAAPAPPTPGGFSESEMAAEENWRKQFAGPGAVVPAPYPWQTTAGVPLSPYPGYQQPRPIWPSLVPPAPASPVQAQEAALDGLAGRFGEDYDKWTPGQKALYAQESAKMNRAKQQEINALRGPLGVALQNIGASRPAKPLPTPEPQSRLSEGFRTPRDTGIAMGLVQSVAGIPPMPAQYQPSMGPSGGLVADRAAAEKAAADQQAVRVVNLAKLRQMGAVANEENLKALQGKGPALGPYEKTMAAQAEAATAATAAIPQVAPEYIARRRAKLNAMWDKAEAEGNMEEMARLRGQEWEFDENGNRLTSQYEGGATSIGGDVWGHIKGAVSGAGEAVTGALGMLEGKGSPEWVGIPAASTTTTFIPGAGTARTQVRSLPLTNEARVARYMAADPTVSRDEALVALGLRTAPVQPTFIPGAGVVKGSPAGTAPTFIPGAGVTQKGAVGAPGTAGKQSVFIPGAGVVAGAGAGAAKAVLPAAPAATPAAPAAPVSPGGVDQNVVGAAQKRLQAKRQAGRLKAAETERARLLKLPMTPDVWQQGMATNQAVADERAKLEAITGVQAETADEAAQRRVDTGRAEKEAAFAREDLLDFEKEHKEELEAVKGLLNAKETDPPYIGTKTKPAARDWEADQKLLAEHAALKEKAKRSKARHRELWRAEPGEAPVKEGPMDETERTMVAELRKNPANNDLTDEFLLEAVRADAQGNE